MSPSLQIALLEPFVQVAIGEKATLRLTVACPVSSSLPIAIRSIRSIFRQRVDLDTSMIPQALTLLPGEVCTLAIDLTFHEAGPANTNTVKMQVNPVGDEESGEMVPMPAHAFRVVPSLADELQLKISRICQYSEAVKVEMDIAHKGQHELKDVEWTIGPDSQVRSGITRRRVPVVSRTAKIHDEFVIVGESVELDLAATCQGERIRLQRVFRIPAASDNAHAGKEFRFLEPRNFSKDTINIQPEKEITEILSVGGVFPVYGGKTRYSVIIRPTNPEAASVQLLPLPGRVEVNAVAKSGREWPFLITVVDNPTLRQTVRLNYIVMINGQPSQGELYLSIRPTNGKLWAVAVTAGLGLTAKGVLGLGPALMNPDVSDYAILEYLGDLIQARWQDLLQIGSIPFLRGALWLTDVVMRQFDDV